MMDDKLLGKAMELKERLGAIKRAMDRWEAHEPAIVPPGVENTYGFLHQGPTFKIADEVTWKAYRRASIEVLQREFDKAQDEFKRL